MHLYKR